MLVISKQTDARNCIPIIALVKRNQDKTSTNKLENQFYQFFPEKFLCNRMSLSVPVSDHLDNFSPLSFPFLSYLLPFYFWPFVNRTFTAYNQCYYHSAEEMDGDHQTIQSQTINISSLVLVVCNVYSSIVYSV